MDEVMSTVTATHIEGKPLYRLTWTVSYICLEVEILTGGQNYLKVSILIEKFYISYLKLIVVKLSDSFCVGPHLNYYIA